jgi:hypothetical protein
MIQYVTIHSVVIAIRGLKHKRIGGRTENKFTLMLDEMVRWRSIIGDYSS